MFASKINVVIIFSQVAIVRGVILFSLLGNTSFITRSSAERSLSLPLWIKEKIPASVPPNLTRNFITFSHLVNLTIFFHSRVQVKKITQMQQLLQTIVSFVLIVVSYLIGLFTLLEKFIGVRSVSPPSVKTLL